MQQSSPSAMSRLRASSGSYPPGLDLRAQYRPMPNQNNTPRSSSFGTTFTGGYASAPLTAPVDFSLPRTPVDGGHGNRAFDVPQLSATMALPQEFSNAYNSPSRAQQQQGDVDFGIQARNQGQNNGDAGDQGQGQGQLSPQQQQQEVRTSEEASYMRHIEYQTEQKRKRSYTIPGNFESP